jgi:transcriptional regulator with GAF, ATPase, and Fis domain
LNLYNGAASTCAHDDEWLDVQSLSAGSENFAGMVVHSSLMRNLAMTVARLALYRGTVLIEGESGTGKELVAHALHRLGPFSQGPFVIFNCSNLVGSLAEAQLFGHVRGAYTDAREDSLGYFRSANGGTLFLDEIGELPLALQPKLLRAVETYEIQPVGSSKSHKINIRIVCATNRDLRAMTKTNEFRTDLYYRLNTSTVRIPPLRERRDGIGALTAHFVECYNRLFDKEVRLISRRALAMLETALWPGNVREFASAIQNAVMYTERDRLCVAEFQQLSAAQVVSQGHVPAMSTSSDPFAQSANPSEGNLDEKRSLRDLAQQATKAALLRALRETSGNCTRTAELLGVSRYTIYRLIARFGLTRRGSFVAEAET